MVHKFIRVLKWPTSVKLTTTAYAGYLSIMPLSVSIPLGYLRFRASRAAWLIPLLVGASLIASRQAIVELRVDLPPLFSENRNTTLLKSYLGSSSNKQNVNEMCPPPYRQLCEVSRQCLAVDVADKPKMLNYPHLVKARVRKSKINRLDKKLLRQKHLRIRSIYMFLHGCGFFTFPLMVMNQLWVAHEHGLIGEKKPIVYMPENHHYFSNTTSNQKCQAMDFWETWFEPVHLTTSWHTIEEDDVWEFTQDSIKSAYYDANGIHAYPYYNGDSGTQDWIEAHRLRAHAMVIQFIRIRPEMQRQAREMFQQLFPHTSDVLGIHMRGTDKRINRKVKLVEYENHADNFLNQHKQGKIFLATDDPSYHAHMNQKYRNRIVSLQDVTRLSWNVLYSNETDKALKSKEALVDMLLLSHTTSLVKCWSAVSEFAVYVKRSRGMNFKHIYDLQLNQKDPDGRTHSDATHDDDNTNLLLTLEQLSSPVTNFIGNTSHATAESNDDTVLNQSRFLPGRLEEGQLNKETELQLLAELDLLASPTCEVAGQRPLQLTLLEWGFGATLNSLVKPVLHALKNTYCLKEPVDFFKFDCAGGWKELFSPLSQYSSGDNSSRITLKPTKNKSSKSCAHMFRRNGGYDQHGRPISFWRPSYQKCMELYSHRKFGTAMLPAKYRHMGHFALVSTMLGWLLRPSVSIQDRIRHEKHAMQWPSTGTPVLGIHFRAGDSCIETEKNLGRQCDAFDEYMREAELMRHKYNVTYIYLATDSDSLIGSSLADMYPGWTFLYVKDMSRGGERNRESVDTLLLSRRLDGCEEARNSLLDILLLSDCDCFIGKFSGNLDRIAYSLMYARTHHRQPYVSLDNAWCFDFGVSSRPSGVNASDPQLYYC